MLLLDKQIAEEFYDIIILGGGVAGLAAAITAGQLGLRVLVLEKDCFWRLCCCSGVSVRLSGN